MSRYTTNYSFRHGLTQEDILCWHTPDDLDDMMSYRDLVATSPEGQFRVLDQNPIHLGFFLSSIEQEDMIFWQTIITFIRLHLQ